MYVSVDQLGCVVPTCSNMPTDHHPDIYQPTERTVHCWHPHWYTQIYLTSWPKLLAYKKFHGNAVNFKCKISLLTLLKVISVREKYVSIVPVCIVMRSTSP